MVNVAEIDSWARDVTVFLAYMAACLVWMLVLIGGSFYDLMRSQE